MGSLLCLIESVEAAEMLVAADSFFETNSLDKGVIIQALSFDKKVFKTKAEVVEYLNGKWMFTDRITETDSAFVSVQLDTFQFYSIMEVAVRRGISASVGKLIYSDADGYFSLLNSDEIKFTDSKSKVKTAIEVARLVDGLHPRFGKVTITKEILASFKKNFDEKVFGKDVVFDFDHEEREASGWPKSLFLSEDGERLYAVVDWTPKGFEALSNREFRYFSPQFSLNYIKPTSGEEFGPTLTGGGITNKPFLDMEAISLNSKGNNVATIELSLHESKLAEKNAEIEQIKLNAKNEAAAILARATLLENENKELKLSNAKAAKTSKFEVLLNSGKACEAQREHFMSGDMEAFAAAAAKLNTRAQGSEKIDSDSDFALSDKELKMIGQMGLSEDEYCKANKLGKYATA